METTHLFLLYDENCPFCAWYTKKFITCGFISENTRLPYSEGIADHRLSVDPELAKNKIALVNTSTNETFYGIDSLLQIFSHKLPVIKTIGKFPPVHFLLENLYSFISYNRKVIAPVTSCSVTGKCNPALSNFWRIFYIALVGVIVHFTVGYYFEHFLSKYLLENHVQDIFLYTAQFAIQFAMFKLLKQHNFYDYAGHLATISLLGAGILLLSSILLNFIQSFNISTELLAPLCFGIVLTSMFIVHSKRINQLGYSNFLTLNWLFFRISIYILVFKLF